MIIPLSSIKPQELLLSCSLDESDAGFALPLRHSFQCCSYRTINTCWKIF